jgi:zinc transport system permease protein
MILTYTFFQNALLGALLASILCGMVGTYIVTRRMVIAGGGVAHASLGGVGLGAYFGFSPLLGAAIFALFSGFCIDLLSKVRNIREDSAIAMLWTFGMSVGIMAAYLAPGFMTDLPLYLFGDILSITHTDLYLTGILTLLTAVFFILFHSAIVITAYDSNFAITQGIPVRFIETVLTICTALTIVACLQLVGIVMIISLLSIPQMTAALFVSTFRNMILWSIFFGLTACIGGLWISYLLNVPSGTTIIFVSVSVYFLGRAIKKLFCRFHN